MARVSTAELPRRMIARRQRSGNVRYYYSKPLAGKRRDEVPLGADRLAAIAKFWELQQAEPPTQRVRKHVPWLPRFALKAARAGAKHRGIDFDLTLEQVEALVARAAGRCEVTGIPFEFSVHESYRVRPWAPSIDRIQSSIGYTESNVRLVCASVNVALNQFGEEVLLRIARGLAAKRLGRRI